MTEDEVQAAFIAHELCAYEARRRAYVAAFTEEERHAMAEAVEAAFQSALFDGQNWNTAFTAAFDKGLSAIRSALAREVLHAKQEEQRVYREERLAFEEQRRVFASERNEQYKNRDSDYSVRMRYEERLAQLRSRQGDLSLKKLPVSQRRRGLLQKQLAFSARMRDYRAWAIKLHAYADAERQKELDEDFQYEIENAQYEEENQYYEEQERLRAEEERDNRWAEMTVEERARAQGMWWLGAPE